MLCICCLCFLIFFCFYYQFQSLSSICSCRCYCEDLKKICEGEIINADVVSDESINEFVTNSFFLVVFYNFFLFLRQWSPYFEMEWRLNLVFLFWLLWGCCRVEHFSFLPFRSGGRGIEGGIYLVLGKEYGVWDLIS